WNLQPYGAVEGCAIATSLDSSTVIPMNRYFRQSWIGLAAGLASSPALIATQDNTLVAVALAAIIGMVFQLVFRHTRYAYIDSLMAGAAFGIPLGALIIIVLFPIVVGRIPQWTAAGMRTLFPELTGWVDYRNRRFASSVAGRPLDLWCSNGRYLS